MSSTRKSAGPLRWVGGKTRFLPLFKEHLPETCHNYFEPFAGGAAVFFDYGYKCTGRAYLSDINASLMNAYEMLSSEVDEILSQLEACKGAPYSFLRDQFNDIKSEVQKNNHWSSYERILFASWFIALNHLNFNGVYRENKKGQYNVPIGKDSNGVTRSLESLNLDKLVEAGEKLAKSQAFITWGSFSPWPFDVKPQAGDVVFLDPPYLEEFSQYDKSGFTVDDHKVLNAQVFAAAQSGACVVLCGSDNAVSREIYGEPTKVVELSRTVGHSKRGKATEAFWMYNVRS